MTKPFQPHKPEEKVVVKITKREAILIMKLRRYAFGKFIVNKMNNRIVRVEFNNSELIDTETDIDL